MAFLFLILNFKGELSMISRLLLANKTKDPEPIFNTDYGMAIATLLWL